MKLSDLPDEKRVEAIKLMRSIEPVHGEMRTVEYCKTCDKFMGARFIPFGIGRGYRVNTCLCRSTGNAQTGTIHRVMTREP